MPAQPRTARAVIACLFVLAATIAVRPEHPGSHPAEPGQAHPITEEQANELTLTLNDAAVRPIQVWVRTAGTIDGAEKNITAHASCV